GLPRSRGAGCARQWRRAVPHRGQRGGGAGRCTRNADPGFEVESRGHRTGFSGAAGQTGEYGIAAPPEPAAAVGRCAADGFARRRVAGARPPGRSCAQAAHRLGDELRQHLADGNSGAGPDGGWSRAAHGRERLDRAGADGIIRRSLPATFAGGVSTDAAQVFGTDLGALRFSFAAGAQSDAISFDGAVVKGTIDLPTSGLVTRGITANFQHLYWPEPPPPKQPGPPPPPQVTSPVAPFAIPPLHVGIGDLRLGKAQLGATTFESAPTLLGMYISKFDSKGTDFTIQSHG